MATQADFWGDIEIPVIRTPAAIMREQAALLGKKTKNIIEGAVETRISDGAFHHSLDLVVPSLDNYTYRLLSIEHGVELYPVTVGDSRFLNRSKLKTEEEFEAWLRDRLSSPETKRIIGNLLAQVNR